MPREVHPVLCCTGIAPGLVNMLVTMPAMLMVSMWSEARVDRVTPKLNVIRYAGFCSLITAPIGMYFLQQVKVKKQVPRGFDCCCPCPYPAWSLYLQLFDLFDVFGLMDEFGAGQLLFFLLNLIGVIMDIVFATRWIKALREQDEDVCCGPSSTVTAPAPSTVVGRPVSVEDENVVTGRKVEGVPLRKPQKEEPNLPDLRGEDVESNEPELRKVTAAKDRLEAPLGFAVVELAGATGSDSCESVVQALYKHLENGEARGHQLQCRNKYVVYVPEADINELMQVTQSPQFAEMRGEMEKQTKQRAPRLNFFSADGSSLQCA